MNESAGGRGNGTVEAAVLRAIDRASRRMTPGRLEAVVGRETGAARPQVRSAIRSLVGQGLLQYTYTFGSSFLERSIRRPVPVSDRITLLPPDITIPGGTDRLHIRILSGAAFGAGDHPSTRLALRGIDHVFASGALSGPVRALDIGTGSGVLALAAVRLGAQTALGLDIDPCARAEAAENVRLNRLEGKIEISGKPLGEIRGRFALITANLRLPTLLRIRPGLIGLSLEETVLVLSGFRIGEWPPLVSGYRQSGFVPLWNGDEKRWSCGAFRRERLPAKAS